MNRAKDTANEQRGSFLWAVVRISFLFIALCGIVFPLVSTGVAQVLFPGKANGSLIKDDTGRVVGSEMIGQSFTDPRHFHGRISSIDYDGAGSGSANDAPSNPELIERTKAAVAEWEKNNPDVPIDQVPIALLTESGSGLDPHIPPKAAKVQIPRISKLTGLPPDALEQLVDEHVEGRALGVFGEPRVNVLKLNLALDQRLYK